MGAKPLYSTMCQEADGKCVFPITHQKGTLATVEGIGQACCSQPNQVEETVLYSIVTRSQAAPQETLSQKGPVFIGHLSVSLRSLMLGFRASEGVGLCQDREVGGRGLTFGDLSTLPLTHCIHV